MPFAELLGCEFYVEMMGYISMSLRERLHQCVHL